MLDNSQELGYNIDNDEHVEVVKMDEQRPVNDTECTHPTLIPDPTDTLENGAIYHGCSNIKCGRGVYLLPNPK